MRIVRLQHATKWWAATATKDTYEVSFGPNGKKGQVATKPASKCRGKSPYRELELVMAEKLRPEEGYKLVTDDVDNSDDPQPPSVRVDGLFVEIKGDTQAVIAEALVLASLLSLTIHPLDDEDGRGFRFLSTDGSSLLLPQRYPLYIEFEDNKGISLFAFALCAWARVTPIDPGNNAVIDPMDRIEQIVGNTRFQVSLPVLKGLRQRNLLDDPEAPGKVLETSHGLSLV